MYAVVTIPDGQIIWLDHDWTNAMEAWRLANQEDYYDHQGHTRFYGIVYVD